MRFSVSRHEHVPVDRQEVGRRAMRTVTGKVIEADWTPWGEGSLGKVHPSGPRRRPMRATR
ncbi:MULTISPECIES: hypothetical protein [Streptomyces]|uniref:hypothetical protein n=1 Tax=Streptomyces TaxID=1883 RepID=UPI0007CD7212|nr:hypothetical protein A4V12_21065 [Streptomyces noursei]